MTRPLRLIATLVLLGSFGSLRADAPQREFPRWLETAAWQLNLGKEFPGATGAFDLVHVDDLPAARLTYDFTQGGRYVGIFHYRRIGPAFTEMRIRYRATTPGRLIVRLFDANGEVFQYDRAYASVPEWVDYRIVLAQSTRSYAEGANGTADKKIDFPLRGILLGTGLAPDKSEGKTQGEAFFSGIELIR